MASKLAEQILRMVSGGDPAVESKIRLAELEYQIQLAGNIVGRQEYFEQRAAENQHYLNGRWAVEYQITLSAGKIDSEKVATLPAVYIDLPYNKGVQKVYYVKDEKTYNITELPGPLYGNMTGNVVWATSKFYYVVRNGALIIAARSQEDVNRLTSVYVELGVATTTTLDEAVGFLIIERVLPWARLQAGIRNDKVTDSNPTT
jgi:hypothetical protein